MKKYRKKAFTLLEVLIVVIVISILASGAVVSYAKSVENAKMKACETNLSILHTALEMYIEDTDTIPGNLAMLPQKYIYLAKKELGVDPNHQIPGVGIAYAQSLSTDLPAKYYGNNPDFLKCKADTTGQYCSYVINSFFDDEVDAKDLLENNPDLVLIGDKDFYHAVLFGDSVKNSVTADGEITKETRTSTRTSTGRQVPPSYPDHPGYDHSIHGDRASDSE